MNRLERDLESIEALEQFGEEEIPEVELPPELRGIGEEGEEEEEIEILG